MAAKELTRDDNPHWLAALVTALPIALGALFAFAFSSPDSRRPSAPVSRLSEPEPLKVVAPSEPNTTRAVRTP